MDPTDQKAQEFSPTVTKSFGGETAQTIFIDGMESVIHDGYNIRVRLLQNIHILNDDGEPILMPRVEANMVMSYRTFRQISEWFNTMTKEFDRQSPAVGEATPIRSSQPTSEET